MFILLFLKILHIITRDSTLEMNNISSKIDKWINNLENSERYIEDQISKIRKEKAEKTFPRKEEDEEGFCLSNIIFSCPKCISTSLLSYKYFERKNTN